MLYRTNHDLPKEYNYPSLSVLSIRTISYFQRVSSRLAGLPSDYNLQGSTHRGSCYTGADRNIGVIVANGFCLRVRDELRELLSLLLLLLLL